MKQINRKAAAPIRRRMSFQDPLSFPGIRFMADGGDGSAVAPGSAPAGDSGEQIGAIDASKITSNDPSAGAHSITANQHAEVFDEDGSPKPSTDDDQGSQAEDPKLRAARDEAYKNRQKANTAAQEKDDLIQTLGKALGLVKDDDEQGKGPDAEALAAQIADEQAKATSAARELAVYKAAASNGADPAKLLDSRSFLSKVSDLDHTDDKAVGTAIKDFVADHKDFALARAAGASTADTASGPGGGSTPKAEVSLEDALASHYNA